MKIDKNQTAELDKYGYPTKKTLKTIRAWEVNRMSEAVNLLEYVRSGWYFRDDYFTTVECTDRVEYHLSTAGWSGNEDIIEALKENRFFWCLCWMLSRRGGHYVFEVRKDA